MRARVLVVIVGVLAFSLTVPAAGHAAKTLRRSLPAPVAGQANTAVFEVRVKGGKKPRLRLKSVPAGAFAVGAIHKVKGSRGRYAGSVTIMRKSAGTSRSVLRGKLAPQQMVIVIVVSSGSVRFDEYDVADQILDDARDLGVDVCRSRWLTGLLAERIVDDLIELGAEPDAWDEDDLEDLIDEAIDIACGKRLRTNLIRAALYQYALDITGLSGHNFAMQRSNECFLIETTPAQGNADFLSELTGPGGYSDTKSGRLNGQGVGTAVHPIRMFGMYTDKVTLRSTAGVVRTMTTMVDVTGRESADARCAPPS